MKNNILIIVVITVLFGTAVLYLVNPGMFAKENQLAGNSAYGGGRGQVVNLSDLETNK
jgi:hypothetical protein